MTTLEDTAAAAGYALDSAWHAERERLDSLTRLYDRGTLRLCRQIGVAAGWRCLDAGAGTGSLARSLVALVAPEGAVTALDIDTRFLEPLAGEHLEVLRADVTSDVLPVEQFDFIHTRLLLEHLPERDVVLGRLIDAVKPGGWVLIEDFDWATGHIVDPPSALHERVATAIRGLFELHGYLPGFGRTLPRRLVDAGLADVTTHAEAIYVRSDPKEGLPQWELLADQFAPALIAAGLLTRADLDAFHDLWHDGRTSCLSPLMVSSWGRKL